jgi:hypothetical protein
MNRLRPGSLRQTLLMLALLLLGHAVYDRWQYAASYPSGDFYIFWSMPQFLSARPGTDIYLPREQQRMGAALAAWAAAKPNAREEQYAVDTAMARDNGRPDAAGSPFLYATTGLLSTGDFRTDRIDFFVLCLAAYLLGIAAICRLLDYSPVATVILLAFFCCDYAPLFSDLRVGNLNQIQILIIAGFVALMAKSKEFWAGLVLGFGLMLKPNISLILPLGMVLLFSRKKYKPLAALLLGVVVAVAAALGFSSAYFAKPSMWCEFAQSLPGTVNLSLPFEKGNIGLPALVNKLLAVNISSLTLLALLAAFVYVAIRAGKNPGPANAGDAQATALRDAMVAGGAGCAIMILSSNLVWRHYYTLLIPLILFTLRPDSESKSRTIGRILALAALLVMSRFVEAMFMQNGYVLPVAYNLVTLLLLAFTLFELWSGRNDKPPVVTLPQAG